MKFDYSFVVILLEASRIIAAETILIVERPDNVSRYKVPFRERQFTWRPYLWRFRTAISGMQDQLVFLNGEILKSQKLQAKFTFK